MDEHADVAILGGSGVYDAGLLEDPREVGIKTPYGDTSGPITLGVYRGVAVAFLSRHGKGHKIPPHSIPYRANIWAMKQLGVSRVIVPTAVGSLRKEVMPGDLVIPDQIFDFTKGREYTFYDGGEVVHVSMAEPFCPEMRKIAVEEGKRMGLRLHDGGTQVCIEGPRFSSRAESLFFRNAVGASTINMTMIPECLLAREMEMCYLSLAMVTDYDAWGDFPVNAKAVVETMDRNVKNSRRLMEQVLVKLKRERTACGCGEALKHARV